MPDLAFGILFLSRGLEPIIVNKLKRSGDWNLHLHDIQHLVEFTSEKYQYGKQWRIVTLEPSVDYLLKVPILCISGHVKLIFTDEEKAKLKTYVERGGTILGEACCSQKPFAESFEALVAELWPDGKLEDLPDTHPIYDYRRRLDGTVKPRLMGLRLQANQGRIGVIYMPNGISCQWERGGSRAEQSFLFGSNVILYIDEKIARPFKTAEQLEQEKVPSVPMLDVPVAPDTSVAPVTPVRPDDGGPVDEEEE